MSDAYDMIDRFLWNNLGSDDDYAEYSKALDSLCGAQPAQAGQEPITSETGNTPDQGASAITAESGKAGQVLTDEDIDAAWRSVPEDTSPEDMEEAISRAIEQAVLAKRVPMTDAQIEAALWGPQPAEVWCRDFRAGIRAAERHHGIVGEKGGA